jgi:hypothetical protein
MTGRAAWVLLAVCGLVAGCGGSGDGGEEGDAQTRTRESGLRIATVTDDETGLELEIEDDDLMLQFTDRTPDETRKRLTGVGLMGQCDGGEGMGDQFPVFWRERFGDWGTALVRPRNGEYSDVLADVLTRCRFYGPGGGAPLVDIVVRR